MLLARNVTERLNLHIGDVTRPFVISETVLCRPVYIYMLKEMGVGKGKIVRVLVLLMACQSPPMSWFKTYMYYHKHVLTINVFTMDPCLVYREGKDGVDAIIEIQMNDTISASRKEFAEEEKIAFKEFLNKEKVKIKENPVRFNGVELAIVDNGDKIIMRQSEYLNIIEKIKIQKEMKFDQFRSPHAQFAYAVLSTVSHVLIFAAVKTKIMKERFKAKNAQTFKSLKKLQLEMYMETT